MAAEAASRWIFLRGLVRESAHWDDFPRRFARALPHAEVRCLDLPGNGVHWRLDSPLSLREAMEFARREAWQTTGGPGSGGPISLLSISMGAMVALEWLGRYPQEVAGAVLINTSVRGINPLPKRLAWRAWPVLARMLATRDTEARERLILRLTSRNATADPALLEARVETYRRHPVRWDNVLRQLWAAARYQPPAEKPRVPLLLLNSLGDGMVAPSCTDELATRWGAARNTHPWAGHDLPLDDPDWVVNVVEQWLRARTAADSSA